ncbi:MAG: glycosyltransferase [Muribaculaceae bacterium]|nr:glycosyltransferase [Muribaculaceae bacterium]
MRLLHPAVIRLFLPKPFLSYLSIPKSAIKEIRRYLSTENSGLWIYGEELSAIAEKFIDTRIVVTTPDCEAMYYQRVFGMKGVPLSRKSIARYAIMLHRYSRMASKFPNSNNIIYHLVGKEDALFLKRLNPNANTIFINHPHYSLSKFEPSPVKPGEKIRLLVAGAYNFTMAQAADEAFEAMTMLPQSVKDRYLITFLGKGWDKSTYMLHNSGFEVKQNGYVEDYAAEVASHHIQLTPVCVGTGTKGKVLDAFANGLMVIGTPLALENIAAKRGSECIEYSTGEELTEALMELSQSPSRISEIAKAGKVAILTNHSRKKISELFFSLWH